MDRSVIRKGIEEILMAEFGLTEIHVTDASTAKDFKGWDSLAHINIIIAAEEKFQVDINAIRAAKLKTVGELIDLIAHLKNGG